MRSTRRAARARAALPVLLLGLASPALAADRDRLLFHAETAAGEVLASKEADEPFNPASVVKVATSLWALELRGPDARWETVIGSTGAWDRTAGRIDGDLVVVGGGDPDFHAENAFLVARELNRAGVRVVSGDLVVVPPFWMGWENGTARPARPEVERSLAMGLRLRDALDSRRWGSTERRTWRELVSRRGWEAAVAPAVAVRGRVRVANSADPTPLIVHRSNPLRVTLRRFNVYSNNDIVRIGELLGGPERLASFLRERLGAPDDRIVLGSTSGQDSNRMSARLVVALMRQLLARMEEAGMQPEELLPVPGCDPGPMGEMFPRLASGPNAQTVVGKSGTLTTTDGGVVAYAGTFDSRDRGRVIFAVGVPGSGWETRRWRDAEQEWLLELMTSLGGAAPRPCGPELPHSDSFAEVVFDTSAARSP